MFCNSAWLQSHPARLKRVCSDGVDGSTQSASQCAIMVVSETHIEKDPSTIDITTLRIDIAKSVFQLHGVDAQGAIVLQKKLRRGAVVKFLSKLEPCLIGIEACATSHYWAREIAALGHDVKMIPPAYVIHMSNAKRMMPQMRKPSARPSRAQTCASCQ